MSTRGIIIFFCNFSISKKEKFIIILKSHIAYVTPKRKTREDISMKASYRNQKQTTKVHNDRQFNVKEYERYDANITPENLYRNYKGEKYFDKDKSNHLSFKKLEEEYYKENYAPFVEYQNEKKKKHRERKSDYLSINKMINSKRYSPVETIYEIGNSEHKGLIPREALIEATNLTVEFKKTLVKGLVVLDMAYHFDEPKSGDHLHTDEIYNAIDDKGNIYPCIDKCLEQAGIELPNPNKPIGQYNNRKITLDNIIREKWYDIIDEILPKYGLDIKIDREVVSASKKHKTTLEYTCEKLKEQLDDIQVKYESSLLEKERLDDEIFILNDTSKMIREYIEKLQGKLLIINNEIDTKTKEFNKLTEELGPLKDIVSGDVEFSCTTRPGLLNSVIVKQEDWDNLQKIMQKAYNATNKINVLTADLEASNKKIEAITKEIYEKNQEIASLTKDMDNLKKTSENKEHIAKKYSKEYKLLLKDLAQNGHFEYLEKAFENGMISDYDYDSITKSVKKHEKTLTISR